MMPQSTEKAVASRHAYAILVNDYGSTTIGDVDQVADDGTRGSTQLETIEERTEVITSFDYQYQTDNDTENDNDNEGESSALNEHYIGSFGSLDIIARRRRARVMDIEQLQAQQPWTVLRIFEVVMNVLAQLLISFMTLYMSWFCLSRGLAGTSLHAWLVTIGFAFLMAEGVMMHYNGNLLTASYKRNQKTRIHWILQAIGGFLGMTGALIKCAQKGFLLHTVHGKLGFIATVLCLLTMITGLGALYAVRLRNLLPPLQNKTFHNVMGLTTFIIAMLAQYYGYRTGYYMRQVSHDFRVFMEYITLVLLVLCCVGPVKALTNKIKSLIRQN